MQPQDMTRRAISSVRVPALMVLCAAVALAACRGEEIAHYRVPKPSSPPAGAAAPAAGSPMVPASGQVSTPPAPVAGSRLAWTLPARWTESTGGGGMRYATLKAPVDGRIDVSVTVLPGEAGGELANVNRWRGQIGLPAMDAAALAAARKPLRTKAGTVSVYDFTNDAGAKSRVVAGLAVVDGNTWFLKMTGDPAAVAAARPDFLRIVESLRRDASNR